MTIESPRRHRLQRSVRRSFLILGVAALVAACTTSPMDGGSTGSAAGGTKTRRSTSIVADPSKIGLYEVRSYTAAEGKMADLQTRARDHELGLFRKYGITPILFATPIVREGQPVDNRLIYLLGYKDRESRDAAWRSIAADPDWKAAYQKSRANGALSTKTENLFLTATDYAPNSPLRSAQQSRTFELRTYTATDGNLENIHKRFSADTMRIFGKHNMTNILYWRPVAGQADMERKMVYMLAFDGVAARDAAWTEFAADKDWQAVRAASERNGRLLDGAPESTLLRPTDFSPLK